MPNNLKEGALEGSTSTIEKVLYSGQPTTSATALVTAPTNGSVEVTSAVVCNPTAGAVTLTLHVVPSGGAAADANMIVKTLSLAAAATVNLKDQLAGLRLGSGESIRGLASAGASLTVVISGRVHS